MDKIHCIRCGGRLWASEEALECSGCATRYSDLLLSETVREEGGFQIREISISADLLLTREVVPKIPLQDAYVPMGDRPWESVETVEPEWEEAA